MLASGHTVVATAKATKVGERTIFRWLQEPSFKAQIDELRAQAWERAAAFLGTASTSAAATLVKLLDDPNVWIRLSSARAILEMGARLHESTEVEQRFAEVESRLNIRGGGAA